MIEVSTVPEVGNVGVSTKVDRATYLNALLNLRSPLPDALSGLQGIRDRAAAVVRESEIPSTRDEEWRFTDLSDLLQVNFQKVGDQPPALGFEHIQSFILPEAVNSRLVFVNGFFDPALSSVDGLPDGVLLTNFAALQELSELSPEDQSRFDDVLNILFWREIYGHVAAAFQQTDAMLGRKVFTGANPAIIQTPVQRSAKEVFAALNGASMTDAAVIYVPQNQVVETPIQLLFVSTAIQPIVSHPRVIVMANSNSHVTLIEDFVALGEASYFTNAVTDISISDNAEVRHNRIQRDSTQAFHIGTTTVSQCRDSRYTCNAVSFGAKLSRHNLDVYQNGEQTSTTLSGLTYIAGEQVADTHSLISYTKPHGTSNQMHKCIVDDRAHAVFNGKIFVPQAAQLTDARQLSKNLLLSEKARVDTKPQLEITADNVKCAHGATVSQLENDEIFYLQSRGISQTQSVRLLTYAFAYEVIQQIEIASLRDALLQQVT